MVPQRNPTADPGAREEREVTGGPRPPNRSGTSGGLRCCDLEIRDSTIKGGKRRVFIRGLRGFGIIVLPQTGAGCKASERRSIFAVFPVLCNSFVLVLSLPICLLPSLLCLSAFSRKNVHTAENQRAPKGAPLGTVGSGSFPHRPSPARPWTCCSCRQLLKVRIFFVGYQF